jgi:hypothetical protein
MISGVFPAALKPRFKLCNDGPVPQCISGNVMGPKLHERQAYRFSYQKREPAAKPANQRHCDDASGKDMGSRWQGYGFCRNSHDRTHNVAALNPYPCHGLCVDLNALAAGHILATEP